MDKIIRHATVKDLPRVLELIQELAVYEKEPDAVEVTIEELEESSFGPDKMNQIFIAEDDTGFIHGIALVYPRFSTWKGKTIHLEDLIVTHESRGKGYGIALYNAVLKHASTLNVRRVEWVVLDWNTTAINFYKASGATLLENWHLAQMDQQALNKYIAAL